MAWMANESELDSWQGQEVLLFSKECRMAQGPIHYPVQWLLGVKWLGCGADHSQTSPAKVMEVYCFYIQVENVAKLYSLRKFCILSSDYIYNMK
jgi:hypothetical protein